MKVRFPPWTRRQKSLPSSNINLWAVLEAVTAHTKIMKIRRKAELKVSHKTDFFFFLEQFLCFLSTLFLHKGYQQCWLCNRSYTHPTVQRSSHVWAANKQGGKKGLLLPWIQQTDNEISQLSRENNVRRSHLRWSLRKLRVRHSEVKCELASECWPKAASSMLNFLLSSFVRSLLNSVGVTPEEYRWGIL